MESGKARVGCNWRAEARLFVVGAGLAVTGDAHQHDLGVDGFHRVVADAPLFQRAGAEVLDNEIGIFDEVQQDLVAFFAVQVQRNAALVAAHRDPAQADLVVGVIVGQKRAEGIALARHLDFNDICAPVCQQRASKRTCHHIAKFDHF